MRNKRADSRSQESVLSDASVAPDAGIRATNEAAILRAAAQLFAEKGFDGTRTSDIAQLAQIPKANVYYYFPSKEAIYAAIIKHLLERWDQALTELQPERAPAEAIEGYIRRKLEYSRDYPLESRLFAGEVLRGAKFLSPADRKHMRAMTRAIAPVLEHWIEKELMDPIDVRHFLVMVWGATQFYADFEPLACDALDIPKLRKLDFTRALETITHVVLKGCGVLERQSARRADLADR